MALRPPFPYRQTQYVEVFPLKPAPFCKLFAGLASTNKSAISSLLLSLCPCHPVLSSVFSFTANFLGKTVFSLLYSQATVSPRTLISPGNDSADELSRWGALLVPFAILCCLFLISCIHSSHFCDWRRPFAFRFFDTQVTSVSTEELVLPRHARCVFSRLRCNGHSLLLSSSL